MTETEPAPFEIKDYRTPLVTSLGVILGFLAGFLAQWISDDQFALRSASDWVVFLGCVAGSAIMLRVLYRMLMPLVADEPVKFYRATLRLYMIGIATAFLSLIAAAFL